MNALQQKDCVFVSPFSVARAKHDFIFRAPLWPHFECHSTVFYTVHAQTTVSSKQNKRNCLNTKFVCHIALINIDPIFAFSFLLFKIKMTLCGECPIRWFISIGLWILFIEKKLTLLVSFLLARAKRAQSSWRHFDLLFSANHLIFSESISGSMFFQTSKKYCILVCPNLNKTQNITFISPLRFFWSWV